MARANTLNSKAGYTCAVVPQSRSDEMLAKREESIYGFATANRQYQRTTPKTIGHKNRLENYGRGSDSRLRSWRIAYRRIRLTALQFIKQSDSVAIYEDNWKTNMPGSLYSKKVSEAQREYKDFCKDVIFKALGRNIFAKRMEALGFVKSKKPAGMYMEKTY